MGPASRGPARNTVISKMVKEQEFSGIIGRHTFQFARSFSAAREANILNITFVCTVKEAKEKEADTPTPAYKGRFVLQGHVGHREACGGPQRINDTPVVRSLTGINSCNGLLRDRVFRRDPSLLTEHLGPGSICIVRPSGQVAKPDSHLLRLRNPLDGILDSGYYGHHCMDEEFRDYKDFNPSMGDPALYYDTPAESSRLGGIVVPKVHYVLVSGSPTFHQCSVCFERKFGSTQCNDPILIIADVRISSAWGMCYLLHQPTYPRHVTNWPNPVTFDSFRSLSQFPVLFFVQVEKVPQNRLGRGALCSGQFH